MTIDNVFPLAIYLDHDLHDCHDFTAWKTLSIHCPLSINWTWILQY